MITTMRDRFRSKKYQIVIWLAIISLFGTATIVELIRRFFGSGDWVMKVDGIEVSPHQFYRKVEEEKQYIDLFRKQFGPYAATLLASSGISLDPKELAKNALTNEILLNKLAKKLNIQFDKESIQNEILKKIPQEVIETYGTVDLNLLSQLFGYTNVNEFEKNIETSLKTSTALELISAALYVPEFEIKNNYISNYSKKKYSILIFPLDKYLNEVKKMGLSKEEVKKYFDDQNIKDKKYWVPEKREGIKWEFNPASYGIKLTEKDLQDYYNKNKRIEFLESPAQVKVRRILFAVKDKLELPKIIEKARKIRSELLADKTKFAEFAKKYSEDKATAEKEGLVDFFAKGQKDPVFEKTAFELKAPGDISDIIETKYGVEILQLAAKKPMTFKKFSDVKEKIEPKAEKDKFDKQFNMDIKRLTAGTNSKDAFEEFAKAKGAKSSKIDLMANDNSLTAQKLFGIKKEYGIDSYVDDKAVAVQLTRIEKSHAPSFDSVKNKVEEDLYKQRAFEKMKSEVKKAKQESSSLSFDKLKDKFDVTLRSTPWIDSGDRAEIDKLQKENIPAKALFEIEREDSVSDILTEKTGYLIKLDHIEPFNQESFENKKIALKDELLRKRRQELEAGFIASLKKNAKININEKALKQFRSAR